ncbi:MAG: DUF615 domain-containing protein [Kangiellaceae bacterium]|nr:DUF615 domain-containing protein [Kangiellaceae bacterium]
MIEQQDDEFISKTRLKKDAQAIKKFGLELTQLSSEKLSQLPMSEVTLKSILDYQKITTNLARKRQLMFVGKCLRYEDEDEIRLYLSNKLNSQLKAKASVKTKDTFTVFVESLAEDSASKVEQIMQLSNSLERQTLRQLVRNLLSVKEEKKKQQAITKFKNYLSQHLTLEAMGKL